MAKKKASPSKLKRPPARKKRRPPFRLACAGCDRDDYDGVYRLPQNWKDIQRYQTLAQSLEEVDSPGGSKSPFDWFTHMGTCPECQEFDK